MKKLAYWVKTTLILGLLLPLFISFSNFIVWAGDARLYLAPSSGNFFIGSTFSVTVSANSGSHSTNAYKAVVSFPTDKLAVSSVSVSGSICSLQITGSPGYSNSSGTVSFECGHTGSFSGTAGRIGTITFTAKTTGTAVLTFTDAQIKAADGAGTEVLGSTGSASYNLRMAPLAAPAVASTTHPDQNSWYAKDDVILSWTRPSGAVDFSYTLNQSSGTIPNNLPNTSGLTTTYQNLSEGIHYFHIKARGNGGWGQTAHFRIRIDTAPPEPFEIESVPSADNVTVAPLIKGSARDATSGISHYELSLDGGSFQEVSWPYQFSRIAEGTHTITVRAFDRAGNFQETGLTLNVIDIEEPVITYPPQGTYLPILERLTITGTAPTGLVELYLNGEFLALVESNDHFSYTHEEFLKPGSYTILAKAITEGGVESSPVESRFTVDPRAVSIFGLNLPGWFVYSFLILSIVGLLALLILILKRRRERERHFVKDIEKIEQEVDERLGSAGEETDRAIQEILTGGRTGRVLRLERRLEKIEEEARHNLIGGLEEIKRHHRIKKTLLPKLPQKIIVTGFLGDLLAQLTKLRENLKKKKKVR